MVTDMEGFGFDNSFSALFPIFDGLPKSSKYGTQRKEKGKLLSQLSVESINLRSHPFRESKYHKAVENST